MPAETVTRRKFLAGAAAGSSLALLPPSSLEAQKNCSVDQRTDKLPNPKVADKIALRAEPFPMPQVRLLPSHWQDMMELNRSYLYSLPNDRLAHNFRVTAGIPSSAVPLGGWEAPDGELRGHYIGHYLSACALLYASSGDTELRNKADALVAILAECQSKDGYLSAYPTTFYDRLRAFKPVWAPFYTYHKILAGMIDMYQHTGNTQALQVATRMADWADAWAAPIPPDQWQKILLVEQGGMNEASFNLYALTGNTKYRDLGYRFEHHKIFDPLAADEDHLDDNHANTNIPKIIGAARGYELTGDERYDRISRNFYHFIVDHHTYCTGGTSNGEFWHAPNAIASQLGPSAEECCCSYNMMKLTRHLYTHQPDARLFDYYERLLMNVRSGTQDPHGMLMYYVSLQPGMYKTFGTPLDSFWCCTGTGSEEYAKLTNSIYFHNDDTVFVNLFIPSTLHWPERNLRLTQTTKFPMEETATFTINDAPTKPTSIKIRAPYWAQSAITARINGTPQNVAIDAARYLTIEHPWKSGDILTVDLPMSLHINQAPDDKQVQAAMYGPLVLAALLGTDDLKTSMIYGAPGPRDAPDVMPMPQIAEPGIWFERAEATRDYPIRFHSKGNGPIHTLVPLSDIMDERYSVYLRNTSEQA
ncbi:MAG: glycoside hydrolase family 127 protein [Acidobacteriaceae bacterium]